MVSEAGIKAAIETIVNGRYENWTIGVTDDPARRRTEHGDPPAWHHWDADTQDIARNVELYFLGKGMKGGGGGLGRADYIYIF